MEAGMALSRMQKAMLDSTPDCIKILSPDGRLLIMNKAGCLALNVPEDSGFGMPWLPLLPKEIYEPGLEALEKAASGQPARFPGKSVSADGIMHWDNMLTPLTDSTGQVVSILCISREITAKTRLEKQLEDALDREKLLSQEMHHRIKNIFSLISGLIFISEKEAVSLGNKETPTAILREKIQALSRASDAVFTQDKEDSMDSAAADLETIIHSVLLPYGNSCSLSGAETPIRRGSISTFALFLHELATNSVKYGALSAAEGSIAVSWTTDKNGLHLTWTETGGPELSSSPDQHGFGGQMVSRIVKAAGGSVEQIWNTSGLVTHLHLPNALCH